MNIKKIGMTALAASLVSVSASAGELSVSGSASINAEGYSAPASTGLNGGTTFSMGNAITLSGSGELDNGMTVSLSYELDEGANAASTATSLFDNHSVTVSSDAMGTLVFSGHGGSTAASSINTTAAGDLYDLFDGAQGNLGVTGVAISESGAGNNSFFYTTPSVMDGVALFASYTPQAAVTAQSAGSVGYGITYTGVEGLTASFATNDINGGSADADGDVDVISLSYAMGPITASYSNNDYDVGAAADDQETSAFALSYTLSDSLSVTYGQETIEQTALTDAEYSKISASYTAGGMTISASMAEGDNIDQGTDAKEDLEYWSLGASFAF
ncbi:porin [Candidatus Pelagibacter ubique]|nr:porin [Candidatus Pelagibacter ubique]